MGGTLREAQQAGFDSKENMMDKATGYYSGRDDKVLADREASRGLQSQQMNMGFIKDLIATAALLGM
jgi:hypothetical protein